MTYLSNPPISSRNWPSHRSNMMAAGPNSQTSGEWALRSRHGNGSIGGRWHTSLVCPYLYLPNQGRRIEYRGNRSSIWFSGIWRGSRHRRRRTDFKSARKCGLVIWKYDITVDERTATRWAQRTCWTLWPARLKHFAARSRIPQLSSTERGWSTFA